MTQPPLKDVEHDQASMDELLARGMKSVPVTIWDDQVVIGFNAGADRGASPLCADVGWPESVTAKNASPSAIALFLTDFATASSSLRHCMGWCLSPPVLRVWRAHLARHRS